MPCSLTLDQKADSGREPLTCTGWTLSKNGHSGGHARYKSVNLLIIVSKWKTHRGKHVHWAKSSQIPECFVVVLFVCFYMFKHFQDLRLARNSSHKMQAATIEAISTQFISMKKKKKMLVRSYNSKNHTMYTQH